MMNKASLKNTSEKKHIFKNKIKIIFKDILFKDLDR